VIWHDAPSRRRTASMPSCWHAGTDYDKLSVPNYLLCSALLQITDRSCSYGYDMRIHVYNDNGARVLVARTVTFRPTLHTSEGLTDNPYDPLTHYHQPCSLRTVHYLLPVPVLRSDLDRYVFTHTTNFKPSDTNGGQVEASLQRAHVHAAARRGRRGEKQSPTPSTFDTGMM